MNSMTLIAGIAALILLVALIAPVSADPALGYSISSGTGSTYSGQAVSMSTSLSSSLSGSTSSPFLGYSVGVKGTGSKPTLGNMKTYASYSSQTAGTMMSYSDSSSDSGLIYSFSKVYSFS